MSLSWEYPTGLLLVLLVPVYVLLSSGSLRRVPFPRAAALKAAVAGSSSTVLASVPSALRACALLVLALAIAGPTTARTAAENAAEGVPLVLAVDLSSSMLAQDFSPHDRLFVAKAALAAFVENRESDPISIVAFAGEALTIVPTTMSRRILQNAIGSLEVGLLTDGTAIGDGLAIAINRLRDVSTRGSAIVLLSDGESNRGTVDPLHAADAAAAFGIPVYTIGIGSDQVSQVPVRAAPSGVEYAELAVGLDEDLLREIASRTGGAYFRAADPGALNAVYEQVDLLLPSVIEGTAYTESVPHAPWLLLLSGLLLLAEWVVRSSRWGAIP